MVWIWLITLLQLHLHLLSCEVIDPLNASLNNLDENDSKPMYTAANKLKDNFNDFLQDPIASINVDYLNNAAILQFRRSIPIENTEIEAKRRSAVDKNFMRFGRSEKNLMRFGKRQPETDRDQNTINIDQAKLRSERSESTRNSRGDNFMRFGRTGNNFMHIERSSDGELKNGNLMRLGRNENLMRFGRSEKRSLMRFGKRDGSLMRFGRASKHLVRAERDDGFMRYGRTLSQFPQNSEVRFLEEISNYNAEKPKIQRKDGSLMRFGRSDSNFVRFGKLDQNFMRFGKRSNMNAPESKVDSSMDELGSILRSNVESNEDSNSSLGAEDQCKVASENKFSSDLKKNYLLTLI